MAITLDRPVDRARPARTNRPEPVRLTPAPGPRRIRVPELVLGVVLVGVFALGAVLWQSSNNRRSPVAVLAAPVGAGRRDRRRPTSGRPRSRSATAWPAVAWDGARQLVGKTAAAALPAATVLVPGLVVDEPALARRRSARRPEARPTAPTRPAASTGRRRRRRAGRPATEGGDAAASVAANASVWDVTELADEAGVLVVLRLSEPDAAAVSAAGRPGPRRAGGALTMALVVLGATRSSSGRHDGGAGPGRGVAAGRSPAAAGGGRSRRWCPRRPVRARCAPQPDRAGRSHPVRLAPDRRVGSRPDAARRSRCRGRPSVGRPDPRRPADGSGPHRRPPARASTTPTSSSTPAGSAPRRPPSTLLAWAVADRGRPAAAPRRDQRPRRSGSLRCSELGEVGVLLVGKRPYGTAEVAANLGAEVLGVLADDPKGAAAIDGTGGSRRFRTSALVRSARAVAGRAGRPARRRSKRRADGRWRRGARRPSRRRDERRTTDATAADRSGRTARWSCSSHAASARPWRPRRSSGRRRDGRACRPRMPASSPRRLAADELDRLAVGSAGRGRGPPARRRRAGPVRRRAGLGAWASGGSSPTSTTRRLRHPHPRLRLGVAEAATTARRVPRRAGRRQRRRARSSSSACVATRMGRSERRFDAANPELNLQLPDGSRLFATMEVSARPSVVIRRHRFELSSLDELDDARDGRRGAGSRSSPPPSEPGGTSSSPAAPAPGRRRCCAPC